MNKTFNQEPTTDIFTVMKNSYNIEKAFKNIYTNIFSDNLVSYYTRTLTLIYDDTFASYLNDFIKTWKFNIACCNTAKEMIALVTNDLEIENITLHDIEERKHDIKNYLELVLNFYYTDATSYRYKLEHVDNYIVRLNNSNAAKQLMTLIKRLGYSIYKNKEGWNILYEQDFIIQEAIEHVKSKNIVEEIIKYKNSNSIIEKKKILTFLSTELHIQKDLKVYNAEFKPLMDFLDVATSVLNNLQLRHDNLNNDKQRIVLQEFTDIELLEMYDYLFKVILVIVTIKDDADKFLKVKKLNSILKQSK